MVGVGDVRPARQLWPKRRIESLDPGGRPRLRNLEDPERRDEDTNAVEGFHDESPDSGGRDDGISGGDGIGEYV